MALQPSVHVHAADRVSGKALVGEEDGVEGTRVARVKYGFASGHFCLHNSLSRFTSLKLTLANKSM